MNSSFITSKPGLVAFFNCVLAIVLCGSFLLRLFLMVPPKLIFCNNYAKSINAGELVTSICRFILQLNCVLNSSYAFPILLAIS